MTPKEQNRLKLLLLILFGIFIIIVAINVLFLKERSSSDKVDEMILTDPEVPIEYIEDEAYSDEFPDAEKEEISQGDVFEDDDLGIITEPEVVEAAGDGTDSLPTSVSDEDLSDQNETIVEGGDIEVGVVDVLEP